MMAHVVRVMNGEKTIRMHYANCRSYLYYIYFVYCNPVLKLEFINYSLCSTYNADFDGDEMNVHFPQDEISRAESVHLVNANKQYIVPTSGNPIRSLIQVMKLFVAIYFGKIPFFICKI